MSYTATSNTNNSTASKLPSPGNHNNLISLQLDLQSLINLSENQRTQYFNKIKKQANYFLLNAFRALQQKNYKLAKDILVYIADSCACIHPPDKQSQELIQLCCQQLAQIKRIEDWNNQRKNTKLFNENYGQKKLELFVMKYNKFSGQFECDQSDRKNINSEVLFYLSKINAILFNEQTTQNLHSMVAMMKIYWVQISAIFLLLILLILTQLTDVMEIIFKFQQGKFNIIAYIISLCFLIPLLTIFFKAPNVKNALFFEKKLSEEIKKINQECRQKHKKILFMMPQGMQLNVKVQHEIDEIIQDYTSNRQCNDQNGLQIDLSRIRKRVTHYYQKTKEGQNQFVKIK